MIAQENSRENEVIGHIHGLDCYKRVLEFASEDEVSRTMQLVLEFYHTGERPNSDGKNSQIYALCVINDVEAYLKSKRYGRYSWNWSGASSDAHIIRNSTEYANWRSSVFERDGYECQKCGQIGGILNAHHINKFSTHPDLRMCAENGITLCRSCHIKEHSSKGAK